MKKIYQTPEMMAAEMAESILQAGNPSLKVNSTKSVNPTELDVKESAWDDFDE